MTKSNIDRSLEIICRDLRKAREKCKWTQKQIAEKVGCSQQAICKFEKGKLNNLYIAFFYTLYFEPTILDGTGGCKLL